MFGNRSGSFLRPHVFRVRASHGEWTRPAGFEPATSCSGGRIRVDRGEHGRVSDRIGKRFPALSPHQFFAWFRSILEPFVREPFGVVPQFEGAALAPSLTEGGE